MKLLDSYVKTEIKKAIKDNKAPILFGLILTSAINIGSLGALANNKRIERNNFELKLVQDINESKVQDEFQEMVEDAARRVLVEKMKDDNNQVFYDTLPLEHDLNKEEEKPVLKASTMSTKNGNYKIVQTRDLNLDTINSIDDEKVEELAKRFKEYLDNTETNISKGELLDAIVSGTIKEMVTDDLVTTDDVTEEKAVEEVKGVKASQEFKVAKTIKEITIDTVDFYSEQEKFDFICDKYNLTEYELKVIISVIYHEAAWSYDDAYRVTNVIYNRTKSNETVRYIGYLTGLDGKSLYAQVIATSHGKDGTAYQQFSGYLPSVAGYDYDKLLDSDPERIKLNGIFDFLISEECVHSFYSFKSSSHSHNDELGATNWIKYTDNGNVYHDMLQQDDLNDENYVILPVDRSVLVRKRG